MEHIFNRKCETCGHTNRADRWIGTDGNICPYCKYESDKPLSLIHEELTFAVVELTKAIDKLTKRIEARSPNRGELGI